VGAWPYITVFGAIVVFATSRRLPRSVTRITSPIATAAIFVAAWRMSCHWMEYDLRFPDGTVKRIPVFPTPLETAQGMWQMFADGMILRYTIASVFRVAAGFSLAVLIGIPLGLWMGWSTRAFDALNPLVQVLRPISPIAWIPLAILWFGIKDAAAIYIVVISSIFPIITGAMSAVHTIPTAYVRSAQNFGVRGFELYRRVLFPASLPQIVISMRIALGVSWMVIVAAEMIAVESGLGYLIMDSRNANNYARVVGGMLCIGLVGFFLDWAMRRLERLDEVRWGFSKLS
jgi:NitT/TauT family transport system permease protein